MALLDQMPTSFLNTIIMPIKLFRFIGIDFFDDKTRIGNNFKFIIYVCLAIIFFIGVILFFVKIKEIDASILDIANAIACFFLAGHSICKFLLIRNKKHLLRDVASDIAQLWPGEDQTQDKRELMDSWLRRSRTICDCVFKFTISGILLYNGFSLILYFAMRLFNGNAAYLLPFPQYYPFEIDALWKYLLVYLMQILATTTIYECSYLPCDMFIFTLTYDVSMLLRLLQYDLVNINVERRGSGAEESLENLKNVVKRHQKILKVAETLDEIFGAIMFSVLAVSSVIICFFGFLGIVIKEKFQRLLYALAALEILVSVFYIMLPGQILSNTSSGVADAAYESLWYESDVRFKKMLVIIIARSQKPCKLRAKGYADVNFETFYKICGTTWSYLTVVNQMYQDSI